MNGDVNGNDASARQRYVVSDFAVAIGLAQVALLPPRLPGGYLLMMTRDLIYSHTCIFATYVRLNSSAAS